MAFPALIVPVVLETLTKIIDKVFPDPAAADAAKLELFKLQQQGELGKLAQETEIATGQIEINKIEAASTEFIKSNWRPATGWVCVIGLAYQFLIRPLLIILLVIFDVKMDFTLLDLDAATLMTLLFGMLGLGWYRTQEKLKGAS